MLDFIAPVLLFIAFLLLLLVTLSVPIIKTIYLFGLSVNVSSSLFKSGGSGSVSYGVFGYCLSSLNYEVVGIKGTAEAAECSKRHLGYTFDSTVANALHLSGLENLITRTTTAALVMIPLACAFTFVTFCLSLFMLRLGRNGTNRLPSLLTLGSGSLAALFATIAFLIDVILVGVVKHRVHNDTDGDVTLSWGNAVWMTLGAVIAILLAMLGACSGIIKGKRTNSLRKTVTV